MIAVPYIPEHLAALRAQPAQADFSLVGSPEYAQWLTRAGPAFSVFTADGLVAIAGLAEEWEGRAQAWAILSADVRPIMVSLTRAIDRYLSLSPYRRIEAQTPEGFTEGRRWLELLRFEAEGPMRNYTADGQTAIRYARCHR